MALDTTVGGASADAYGSLTDFQTYASNMGWTLTATDALQESYNRRAVQYLDRHFDWKGDKDTDAQALQWPRSMDELVDGYKVLSTTIPKAIREAQFELAWIVHGGGTLFATVENGAVKRLKEKVDVIETETEYVNSREVPLITEIAGLVRPYSNGLRVGGFGSISMVRG